MSPAPFEPSGCWPGQSREAVLAAWGIGADGRKVLLALMAGSKDDTETVRAFFQAVRSAASAIGQWAETVRRRSCSIPAYGTRRYHARVNHKSRICGQGGHSMRTAKEYAKNATAALHRVLHISPDDFDAEEHHRRHRAGHKERPRERESRARRQLKEVQAAAQERLARLLSSSPAVIYSFKATGDFAPTFVSDNIIRVFGYAPAEYLEDPSFWRDRVHPDDLARVEDRYPDSSRTGSTRWSIAFAARTAPIAG